MTSVEGVLGAPQAHCASSQPHFLPVRVRLGWPWAQRAWGAPGCRALALISPSSPLFLEPGAPPGPALTFSLSMASSLPGANKRRSCKLDTEAARLDRAESEDEGLMPTRALVTVERLSGA